MGIPGVGMTQASRPLSLSDAKALARRVSPDLTVAREAVRVASALERQAAAYPNPTTSYGREQTSGGGQSNSQQIAALEQPLELPSVRTARRRAAQLRREAADVRFRAVEMRLDFEVTQTYMLALAADRRAMFSDQAAKAFQDALRISEERLKAGDISGYTNRRLKLEAARYATLRAEALLARQSASRALMTLLDTRADSSGTLQFVLSDSLSIMRTLGDVASLDSLLMLARQSRAELRAAELEAQAIAADATLAARERFPMPNLSSGFKTERAAGFPRSMNGFTLGLSISLPLWDRRAGTIAAKDAESRQQIAEVEAQRRRIMSEVADAYDAYRSAQEQLILLAPQLGPESQAALRAAQVAYAEGEISLVEWLDAMRAYREAESSFATLQAEAAIRRANLERAVGTAFPLTSGSSSSPTNHSAAAQE
jgi:cobalt-zinc-cadmium efflux system outer membrane protein